MVRRRVSNPLALAVLACLAQRPMHPYEMSATMREQHKDAAVKLNFGSLYSVVDALQRAGFVEAKETTRQGNRPERTTYAITEAGMVELAEWVRELLGTPVKEYRPLTAGLAFIAALPPDEAAEALRLRRRLLAQEVQARRATLDAARDGTPSRPALARVFQVEDEYELAMKEAELAWVNDLVTEFDQGTFPGTDEWRRYHQERG